MQTSGKEAVVSKIKAILLMVFVAAVLIVPAVYAAQSGKGSLEGYVFKDDLKTPVANAVVKIRNSQSGEEYQSKPTDAKGAFAILSVTEGRYILGITTEEGNFNFDYEIFIKQGETGKLSIGLKKGGSPALIASLNKKGFFTKPLGLAVVIGAGGALVFGVALVASNDSSPTKK
jgi:hypothetical protein